MSAPRRLLAERETGAGGACPAALATAPRSGVVSEEGAYRWGAPIACIFLLLITAVSDTQDADTYRCPRGVQSQSWP